MSLTVRAHIYREGDYSRPEATLQAEPTTVREALEKLFEQNSEWRTRVLSAEGEIRRFVNVYVNDEDVRFLQKLDTPLQDGDEINIIPAVCGG